MRKHVLMIPLLLPLLFGCGKVSDISNPPGKSEEPVSESFSVIFDSRGGSKTQTQVIQKGDAVKRKKNPTRDGFIFYDWFYRGVSYDFSQPIEEDINLEAIWMKEIARADLREKIVEYVPSLEIADETETRYALFYSDDSADYYIFDEYCYVCPKDVKNPVCLDGFSIDGKFYPCLYLKGKSDVWESIELPHTLYGFLGDETICKSHNLKTLIFPDSVKYIYKNYGGLSDGTFKLTVLHFGYQFVGYYNRKHFVDFNATNDFQLGELKEINLSPNLSHQFLSCYIIEGAKKLEKITVDPGSEYESFEGMVVSKGKSELCVIPKGNTYFKTHSFESAGIHVIRKWAYINSEIDSLDLTGIKLVEDNAFVETNIRKVFQPSGVRFENQSNFSLIHPENLTIFTTISPKEYTNYYKDSNNAEYQWNRYQVRYHATMEEFNAF